VLKVTSAPISLLVLSVLGSAACDAQRLRDTVVFTAATINGRPLPFTDSARISGALSPVQQIRAWRLSVMPPERAELTSTFKDFTMTRFPCEVQRSMRDALMGNDSGNNAVTALKDTSTTGCDDLSIITLTVVVQYRRMGDSVVFKREGEELLSGTWRGDTLTLFASDESAKRLIAIRQH